MGLLVATLEFFNELLYAPFSRQCNAQGKYESLFGTPKWF